VEGITWIYLRIILTKTVMAEIVKKWYVVRAVSGKEKKVKEYLELEISRMKLNDYVNQVLIPTEKVFKIQNGKKVNKEKAFLPGYVLIEAALVGEVSHVIKSIPNVIGFLGTEKGGAPVPMRLAEVNRILGKVDELAMTEEELKIPFVIGESVKVIDGPFNNFSGVVDEINEDKKKLKVMVKIFGRKNLLELNYMQVEKEG
jgi:transcriptional antiterminator NusG